MPGWVRTRVALVLASVAAIAGCSPQGGSPGSATPTIRTTPAASPTPLVMADGEPLVTCGGDGLTFKPSVMQTNSHSGHDDAAIVAALERLVREGGMNAPTALQGVDVKAGPWFVLGKTDTEAEIATGSWSLHGPGKDAMQVILEKRDGEWRAAAWGTCNLAPVPPDGIAWASVSRASTPPDPAATSVPVAVSEYQCTSGRDPSPYLHEPIVVEQQSTVTVYWTTTPFKPTGSGDGGVTCPGVAVERRIALARPLGDRALLDGSKWPPAPIIRD